MTDKETDLHDQREQIAKAARSFYALANDLSANGVIRPAQSALALATAGAHALRDVFGEPPSGGNDTGHCRSVRA